MRSILYCLSFVMLTYGCSTQKSGTPSATVNSFIDASKSGNLEEVKKHITKSDLSLLEMGENFLAQLDPARANEMKMKMATEFKEKTKDAKIKIQDETINGDEATVNVSFEMDGTKETRPFSLKKENGAWKIALVSTGMKNAGKGEEDIEEAMKNLNVDSLKNAVKIGMEEFNKLDKDSVNLMMQQAMKELDALKDSNR